MAAATKTRKAKNPYEGHGSAGNNDGSRKAKTRKEEKCQWCHTKVPLEEQFVVYNDIENQKVIKAKDATKAKHEKYSHYCSDCADKRKATKEKFDESVNRGAGGKKKVAKKGKAKPAVKKAAEKPEPKKAGKRKVVRRKKGSAGGSKAKTSDPF
jgi:hypothetical protein